MKKYIYKKKIKLKKKKKKCFQKIDSMESLNVPLLNFNFYMIYIIHKMLVLL